MILFERPLNTLGYNVELWILNAANYGVPQTRERIFIVGNNLGIEGIGKPPFTHTLVPKITVDKNKQLSLFQDSEVPLASALTFWDAISDLPELQACEGEEVQSYSSSSENPYQHWVKNNSDSLFNHVAMKHSQRLVERFKHIGWGRIKC